jgi:hypothetical protein
MPRREPPRERMPLREAISIASRVDPETAVDRVLAHLRSGEIEAWARTFSGGPDFFTARDMELGVEFWAHARLTFTDGAIAAVAEGVRERLLTEMTTGSTRPPYTYRATGIFVSRDDVLAVWPEPAPEAPERIEQEKPKGGAPRKYDWDTFDFEVIWIADLDGLPESRGDFARQMHQWCINNGWGDVSESSVEKRVSKIYRHRDRRNRAKT